ncbi:MULTISPECIES: hypothetical protein [unclassified Streptomyces]|uniref:hypothetical protein n=1 Tax=unclassified Streptomyces TaxID=2593676 RepID=UPI002E315DB2|nr:MULTISPECIES: hypothetical protein [unclassified Streptomyces]WUC68986.1 hypothetical protein OG861_32530 [Streptomyces sp. NBC_00539]
MHETFRFRYLHAGMGLAADLHVDAYETVGPPPPPTLLIHRSLYLRLPADQTPYWLEAAWLAFGASLHAEQLVDGRTLVLDVDAFTYPGADFRAEVAALALDGWIHRRFGLAPCGASVAYNRLSHRFAFTWPSQLTPFADEFPA